MKKAYKIITYLLFALILAVGILLLSSFLPIPGGIKVLVVQSGSMEPAIKTGSIVVISPSASYMAGDIITFGESSHVKTPTTHRIDKVVIENGQVSYATKGDANNAPDSSTVPSELVLGKVRISIPLLGYVISVLRRPYGFVFLIIIPAIMIVFEQIKRIAVEVKKLKEKPEAKE